MDKYVDPQYYISWLSSLWYKFLQLVIDTSTLLEIAIVSIALLMASMLARPILKRLNRTLDNREWRNRFPGRFIRALLPLVTIVFAILLLRIGAEALEKYELPVILIDIIARLLTAWVIVRFTTAMIRDSNWARLLSITAWLVAALHILKLLIPAIELLEKLAIDLGGVRISLLLLIKGVIVFSVLLKLASTTASMMEKRISAIKELTPSVQVLLTKALTITLLTVRSGGLRSAASASILSAFAFIGGAIGVGIGFWTAKGCFQT